MLFPAVVKTTVLLADMKDFTKVNDVYKQCEYVGISSPFLFYVVPRCSSATATRGQHNPVNQTYTSVHPSVK